MTGHFLPDKQGADRFPQDPRVIRELDSSLKLDSDCQFCLGEPILAGEIL